MGQVVVQVMKMKKFIKEIKNTDGEKITISKKEYIALLEEIRRLRFKCSNSKNRKKINEDINES